MQPSGAGLSPKATENTYVVKGDLLLVPAKRRRSPRPATPNSAGISDPPPHIPLPILHPGPALPDGVASESDREKTYVVEGDHERKLAFGGGPTAAAAAAQ